MRGETREDGVVAFRHQVRLGLGVRMGSGLGLGVRMVLGWVMSNT